MNNQTTMILEELRESLENAQSALKRLEGVEGLERRLVAQAAERAERQGAVEERSREGRRVAPVKAEALARKLKKKAASYWKEEKRRNKLGDRVGAAGSLGAAAAYAHAAEMVREAFDCWEPKPESGAGAGK